MFTNSKRNSFFIFFIVLSINIYSQNENPFAKYGYDVLTATSSKGEFTEFHDQTDIVEIGSVLFNTRTNEIIKILDKDETTIDISSATTAMSIDPHCEKYYWISPYVYCKNNPILRIDPDGMDDYTVNEKGQIVLHKETEDKTDRLIALGKNNKVEYDDDGNMTNVTHEIKKGVLDKKNKMGETTYMSVSGNDEAKGLFEFLGDNTAVEWGRVSYGKNSNYIATNNNEYDVGIQDVAYEKLFKVGKVGLIKSIDHSHPDGLAPSGFGVVSGYVPKGAGDKAFAEWLHKYYPSNASNIKLRVYNPVKKEYTRFNNKQIFPK